ncbi:MAG: pyridoxamine 5'-phosphate oxidase family protein [Promethearchaeota archaeon]
MSNTGKELRSRSRDEIERDVISYLDSHRILTMATASKEGDPDATALEYANDGVVVYVTCRPGSRKVSNIKENSRVFFEIHDDVEIAKESLKHLQALQVSAVAEILSVTNPQFDPAFNIMLKKFPVFENLRHDSRVILKFIPRRVWFLNYKIKFFHREEINFEEK